jgi:[ribosomal protein S5]-alanine N-acetyltransferase
MDKKLFIETERVIIKAISLDYKEDIFQEFTSEITTYMFPKPSDDISEVVDFINKSVEENNKGSNFQAEILRKDNNEFLGCGGVHKIDKKTPELGIWIKKSAHGNGYGAEAVTALKKWADENLDYKYLLYPVEENNIASKKIPEFLGGKLVREYDEKNLSGRMLHLLEYHIYPNKKSA